MFAFHVDRRVALASVTRLLYDAAVIYFILHSLGEKYFYINSRAYHLPYRMYNQMEMPYIRFERHRPAFGIFFLRHGSKTAVVAARNKV